MKNSKLVRVLKTFTKSEFKEFEKFAASPYFSRGRNLMPLLCALKKYFPEFDRKNFTKENILKTMIRKKTASQESLLKMQMSELYKMAEEYLTLAGFKARRGLKEYFFISQCRQRGLISIGKARAEREIGSMDSEGIDRWYYMYYLFNSTEKINLEFGRDNPALVFSDTKKVTELAVHQFLCTVARYIFNLSAMKIFHNEELGGNLLVGFFDDPGPEAMLRKLEGRNDKVSKASRIYLLSILTNLKQEKEDYYFMFRDAVLESIDLFTIPERFFLLHSLIVKAIYFMDTKDYSKYAREAFRIINFRLDKKLYKETPAGPYTSVEYFLSLKIGFILNEGNWMETYISKHIAEVPDEHRSETEKLSNAFLKFSMGDHSASLRLASRVSGLPFVLIYELKCLMLMAQYELNMTSQAFYMLEAFRLYLHKNINVSAYFMESNLNFIKYYLLVSKYKIKEVSPRWDEVKKVSPRWDEVKKEIESSNTGYKNWLLEKIDEFVAQPAA